MLKWRFGSWNLVKTLHRRAADPWRWQLSSGSLMALRETHVYFTTLFRSLIIRAFQYSLQVSFKGACWALWKNSQVEVRKELGSCLPLSKPSDLGEVTQMLSALFSSLARRGCSYITGFLWRVSMAKQRTHQADGWAHMRSPPSLPRLCSRLKGPRAFRGLREDLGHPAVLRAPEETQLERSFWDSW